MYSYGHSEIILGKAIKQLNLPRDEIVVMTKVFGVVRRGFASINAGENEGYVNQHGLSRKV